MMRRCTAQPDIGRVQEDPVFEALANL